MEKNNSSQSRFGILSRLSRSNRRRFAKNEQGATAIEFVMLALPFTLLIFAILETCISFAGQQILSNATDKIARQIRTGQLKAAVLTETRLRTEICDEIKIIVAAGCPELEVDLREYATFADAAAETIKYTGSAKTGTSIRPDSMSNPENRSRKTCFGFSTAGRS